ncbi:MAG: hypothetical protein M1819_003944 [Sarea resinae]|nr:MAG: hypothetical protein M1819_003944 [Sarea resinae]
MDTSPSGLFKALVPKVPYMVKTALWHSLSLSPTSRVWDLRTEMTIKILRAFVATTSHPSSISEQQRLSLKDPGVKGPIWISRVTIPVDEKGDEIRKLVFGAIDDLAEEEEMKDYPKPDLVPVEAEWTGYRSGVDAHEPEPVGMAEEEKYKRLMDEVQSDVTVLYFHGGAYYLLDPASHRPHTSRLAKLTHGRVFSVRYRLAPQHPFPAALMDALVAYLALLYPPPGSLHAAVPASKIVFAGDSAGGGLVYSLIQLLLQLNRTVEANATKPGLPSHGQNKTSTTTAALPFPLPLPLPAGLATNSPYLDLTRSLPSLETNARYDYLPPPSLTHKTYFPPCAAWPASPPRADLYAPTTALLTHALVSPLAARSWARAPPMAVVYGQELLSDEIEALAGWVMDAAAPPGAPWTVRVRKYEAMPHCFAMVLPAHPASAACFDFWAACIVDFVRRADASASSPTSAPNTSTSNTTNTTTPPTSATTPPPPSTTSSWTIARAPSGSIEPFSPSGPGGPGGKIWDHADVLSRMQDARRKRELGLETAAKEGLMF